MTSMDRTVIPFPTLVGAQSTGWITSLVLHATLAFGAFVFTQQLNLAPQPAPFKWNLAMVESTHPSTTNTAVPSAEPAATLEKPRPSTPLPRKLSPASTPQSHPPPLSPPSPTSKQSTYDATAVTPAPPIPTLPAPSEPVAKERTVVRAVEPASQSIHVESAPVLSGPSNDPERESLPQTHEPTSLTTVPPQVSRQNSVTEPTASTTPNGSVKSESTAEQQQIAMAPVPSAARTDYGWLRDTITRRVEELKRYPSEARLDRAEGRVVLIVVIRGDGSVDDVEVSQSSGYRSLDHAAVELLKQAAPFQLPQPLGKSQMTVKIPMNYRLEQ